MITHCLKKDKLFLHSSQIGDENIRGPLLQALQPADGDNAGPYYQAIRTAFISAWTAANEEDKQKLRKLINYIFQVEVRGRGPNK